MELEIYQELSRIDQLEADAPSISDLKLEKQLKYLETLKLLRDCEKGRAKGKGFANSLIKNQKRDSKVFTVAESNFKLIAESFDLNLLHELPIKVKDRENHRKIYKLDFYDPKSRIAFEINPDFHYNYKPVFIRDKIRKLALKKHGIRVFSIRVNKFNAIDVKYARKCLKIAKEANIAPECLEYWFNKSQLLNSGGIALGTKEPEKELKFVIQPIPIRLANSSNKSWHNFGFGLVDSCYYEKGTYYLPNYSDKGRTEVNALEYRINSSDSENGTFKWVIESIIHETLHSALFGEIGTDSVLFDNIDKIDDCRYKISSI